MGVHSVTSLKLEISDKVQQRIRARMEGYHIEAGILDDKPYRLPKPVKRKKKVLVKKLGKRLKKATKVSYLDRGTLEGGPVRKKKSVTRGTIAQVGEKIRKNLGIDYLRTPIRRINSSEMKAFRKAFILFLFKRTTKTRAQEALRLVLRNPIKKMKYGRNSPGWAAVKTFNRKLFDTGQFYSNIKARIKKVLFGPIFQGKK